MDAVAIDMHPQVDYCRTWILFFVLFMLFGWAFMVRLLIGVIIESFNEMKDKLGGSVFLTDSQKEWVRMQQAMQQVKPRRRLKAPTDSWARRAFHLCTNSAFENGILGCIVLNALLLAYNGFALEQRKRDIIESANFLFSVVFTLEAVLKLFALRSSYFKDSWNVFDLSIVVGTWLGKVFHFEGAASIVRTFRVARIMRIVKRSASLRQIVNTVMKGLPSFLNIGALFFLFLFIFAVAGVQLFADIKLRSNLTVHVNFQDFFTAFVTLFRATTGENWNGIMYDMAEEYDCDVKGLQVLDANVCGFRPCGSFRSLGVAAALPDQIDCTPLEGCGSFAISIFYWISFTFLITWTFLNVFIAAILDLYADEKSNDELQLAPEQYEEFAKLWSEYDEDATCFIDWSQLMQLVARLGPPLGFVGQQPHTKGETSILQRKHAEKIMAELYIPIYENNRVFFSDVVHALAQRIVKEHAKKSGERFDIPESHALQPKWKHKITKEFEQSTFKVNHYYAASAILSSYKNLIFRRKFREHCMRAKMEGSKFRPNISEVKAQAKMATKKLV